MLIVLIPHHARLPKTSQALIEAKQNFDVNSPLPLQYAKDKVRTVTIAAQIMLEDGESIDNDDHLRTIQQIAIMKAITAYENYTLINLLISDDGLNIGLLMAHNDDLVQPEDN